MEHLPKKTCQNGISYTLVGDYYIPDLQLPEENRPIGIWGRMHKAYLEQCHPAQYNDLILTGKTLDIPGGSERTGTKPAALYHCPDRRNGRNH